MQFIIIALIIFLLDQLSKVAAIRFIENAGIQTIPIIDGVLHFTVHHNAGAAFGILQEQRSLFIILTTIVVVGILFSIYKYHEDEDKLLIMYGLALLLGGALGNFVDRLFLHAVVDFIDFRLINYPIFNIADMAIVFAVVILLIDTWLTYKAEQKTKKVSNE